MADRGVYGRCLDRYADAGVSTRRERGCHPFAPIASPTELPWGAKALVATSGQIEPHGAAKIHAR
jgi:hypothetical protein